MREAFNQSRIAQNGSIFIQQRLAEQRDEPPVFCRSQYRRCRRRLGNHPAQYRVSVQNDAK
jgi:hypothetical protein